MLAPRRILAVDDDPLFLRLLGDRLTPAGFVFEGLREASRAVPHSVAFAPDLMLVDRHMPVLTGSEVIRSLRAFPQTAHIPVAMVTGDTKEIEVLRAFRAGALDVLQKPVMPDWPQRLNALLDELAQMRAAAAIGGPSLLAQRLLAFYRRARRTGQLLLNADTPFGGHASFEQGELVGCQFGPLEGVTAFDEMLTFDDGDWEFRARQPEQAPVVSSETPRVAGPMPEFRILVVDDDDDIRELYQKQLRKSGFAVEAAEDGQVGCELALEESFDLILADLNMPRLDGWGMLRKLRADHRTRDIPVVFLSAHDDYREALKAAHSGAYDYLAKTGRVEDVVGRLRAALAPRVAALDALRQGGVSFRVGPLGPQWLLRRIARLGLTGRLQAQDSWGRYTVVVRDGEPIAAKSSTGGRDAGSIPAVAAFLMSRNATAEMQPGQVDPAPSLANGMDSLIRRAAEALNHLDQAATQRKLSENTAFDIDEDLYALFRKVASDKDLMFARAVCEQRWGQEEIQQRLALSAAEVQEGLKELLRRKVISFRGEP